jgi:hypothetical protein
MFSSSFPAPIAALIAYVAVVSAAPATSTTTSLAVNTSIPKVNVDGFKNLEVTTTIVNTGAESLKPIDGPRGALGPLPGNSSIIADASGSRDWDDCDDGEKDTLIFDGGCAHSFITTAYHHILTIKGPETTSGIYRLYFGAYDEERLDFVRSTLAFMAAADQFTRLKYWCLKNCDMFPPAMRPGMYAFTRMNIFQIVFRSLINPLFREGQ